MCQLKCASYGHTGTLSVNVCEGGKLDMLPSCHWNVMIVSTPKKVSHPQDATTAMSHQRHLGSTGGWHFSVMKLEGAMPAYRSFMLLWGCQSWPCPLISSMTTTLLVSIQCIMLHNFMLFFRNFIANQKCLISVVYVYVRIVSALIDNKLSSCIKAFTSSGLPSPSPSKKVLNHSRQMRTCCLRFRSWLLLFWQ